MARQKTALGRMYAWLQNEVPATVLEAYRRASLPVFEVMDLAEGRRLECATDGLNPWTVPPATRAELLCAWNAFVLQTLGNEILDADYEASPATTGYVPSFTAHQVLAFYGEVEEWLTRARQAHANPDFRLGVQVPAELPEWKTSTLEPVPEPLLHGILRAMRTVGEHAAAAMSFLPENAPEPAQQAQLNRIRHVHASAESKARYALDLHGTDTTPEVHRRLQPYAHTAIELFYLLGQLIADPLLAAHAVSLSPAPPLAEPAPAADAAPSLPSAPPVAGLPPKTSPRRPAPPARHAPAPPPAPPFTHWDPGFDIWCLTDPEARTQLRQDPEALRALVRMWRQDPDPERTRAVHEEIQIALGRGTIAYAFDGRARLGFFHRCPWGAIYVAVRPVTLGGRRLQPMQRFVYNVGAANSADGFRRGILFGNFQETGKVEYGPRYPEK